MATHFSKFNGLKGNLAQKPKSLKTAYINQMIVREQVDRKNRLHPNVKRIWNRITQEPQPLSYKLHDWEAIRARQPFLMQVEEEEIPSTYATFEKYKNFHVNEPLGPLEPLPFVVQRTHQGNLPVYTEYK